MWCVDTHSAGGSILAGHGSTVIDIDLTVPARPSSCTCARVVSNEILWKSIAIGRAAVSWYLLYGLVFLHVNMLVYTASNIAWNDSIACAPAHVASCSILARIGGTLVDVYPTVGAGVPRVTCTGVHGDEILKKKMGVSIESHSVISTGNSATV